MVYVYVIAREDSLLGVVLSVRLPLYVQRSNVGIASRERGPAVRCCVGRPNRKLTASCWYSG